MEALYLACWATLEVGQRDQGKWLNTESKVIWLQQTWPLAAEGGVRADVAPVALQPLRPLLQHTLSPSKRPHWSVTPTAPHARATTTLHTLCCPMP